jgi:hypothetical protein
MYYEIILFYRFTKGLKKNSFHFEWKINEGLNLNFIKRVTLSLVIETISGMFFFSGNDLIPYLKSENH